MLQRPSTNERIAIKLEYFQAHAHMLASVQVLWRSWRTPSRGVQFPKSFASQQRTHDIKLDGRASEHNVQQYPSLHVRSRHKVYAAFSHVKNIGDWAHVARLGFVSKDVTWQALALYRLAKLIDIPLNGLQSVADASSHRLGGRIQTSASRPLERRAACKRSGATQVLTGTLFQDMWSHVSEKADALQPRWLCKLLWAKASFIEGSLQGGTSAWLQYQIIHAPAFDSSLKRCLDLAAHAVPSYNLKDLAMALWAASRFKASARALPALEKELHMRAQQTAQACLPGLHSALTALSQRHEVLSQGELHEIITSLSALASLRRVPTQTDCISGAIKQHNEHSTVNLSCIKTARAVHRQAARGSRQDVRFAWVAAQLLLPSLSVECRTSAPVILSAPEISTLLWAYATMQQFPATLFEAGLSRMVAHSSSGSASFHHLATCLAAATGQAAPLSTVQAASTYLGNIAPALLQMLREMPSAVSTRDLVRVCIGTLDVHESGSAVLQHSFLDRLDPLELIPGADGREQTRDGAADASPGDSSCLQTIAGRSAVADPAETADDRLRLLGTALALVSERLRQAEAGSAGPCIHCEVRISHLASLLAAISRNGISSADIGALPAVRQVCRAAAQLIVSQLSDDAGRHSAPPQELAAVLRPLAQLGYKDSLYAYQLCAERIADDLALRRQRVTFRGLATTLEACATAGVTSHHLFNAAANEAVARLVNNSPDVDWDSLERLLWAYAVMRGTYPYTAQRVFKAADAWVVRHASMAPRLVPVDTLGELLWSCAAMGHTPQPLFEQAAHVFNAQPRSGSARLLESLAWSYDRAGIALPEKLQRRWEGLQRSRANSLGV